MDHRRPANLLAVIVFFAVGVSVASVVDLAARRTPRAARLRTESETLSSLAGSVRHSALPRGCARAPTLPKSPTGGNSVEVLLSRYAKCLHGRQPINNQRVEGPLRAYDPAARAGRIVPRAETVATSGCQRSGSGIS